VTTQSREELHAKVTSAGGWGWSANADTDYRYVQPYRRMRRKCGWDRCTQRATHVGKCNGLSMASGCEWHMRLWAREGRR
jgi:hypothetical protein